MAAERVLYTAAGRDGGHGQKTWLEVPHCSLHVDGEGAVITIAFGVAKELSKGYLPCVEQIDCSSGRRSGSSKVACN